LNYLGYNFLTVKNFEENSDIKISDEKSFITLATENFH